MPPFTNQSPASMAIQQGGIVTPAPQGMAERILRGLDYVFTGRSPLRVQPWFGAGEPPRTVAPDEVKGRRFDFPWGLNTTTRVRQYEAYTFDQLKALADNCVLLRLAIETRKDQMAKLVWSIQPRKKAGAIKRPVADDRCQRLEDFFQMPDRENSWQDWLRELLEEMFVIDAVSIYARRAITGAMFSLELINGAEVKPIVDQNTGRVPRPPEAAYQRILKGMPAAEYTTDELIYAPRNKRVSKLYGFSVVEQIVMTVNTALRRDVFTLQYFTEGNIPEALITLPPEWDIHKVAEFQAYWDALHEGNTAARRHARFVQGGTNIQFTREADLKGEFDEWLARVIMFAFSLPPLPFVKNQNRSSAETAYEVSLEEGLEPLMVWIKGLVDRAIAKLWGWPDLEFVWDDTEKLEEIERAGKNIQLVRAGIISIDEAREEEGKEPLGMGPACFGIGPLGYMFVEDMASPEARQATMEALQPPQMGVDPVTGEPIMLESASGPSQDGILSGVPSSVLEAVGLTPDGRVSSSLLPSGVASASTDPLVGSLLQTSRRTGRPGMSFSKSGQVRGINGHRLAKRSRLLPGRRPPEDHNGGM